jgi:ATP-dependent protease ClpP protease subunit
MAIRSSSKKSPKSAAKPRKRATVTAPKARAGLRVQPITDRIAELRDDREWPRPEGAGVRVQVSGDSATIDLYDVIGGSGEATAKSFRQQLNAIKAKSITLRINSPGGYVFDAIAIYNDLVAHPAKVRVEVVGLAASAASLIAMAGDTITMAENAFLMIHNAWIGVIGDKREVQKAYAVLDKIDAALARTYAARSGLSTDDVVELMNNETWFDAHDAVSHGLADSVAGAAKASAKIVFDPSLYFVNIPETLMRAPEAPATVQGIDFLAVLDGARALTSQLKGYVDARASAAG